MALVPYNGKLVPLRQGEQEPCEGDEDCHCVRAEVMEEEYCNCGDCWYCDEVRWAHEEEVNNERKRRSSSPSTPPPRPPKPLSTRATFSFEDWEALDARIEKAATRVARQQIHQHEEENHPWLLTPLQHMEIDQALSHKLKKHEERQWWFNVGVLVALGVVMLLGPLWPVLLRTSA